MTRRRSEVGSAGLLALILSCAFAGVSWFGLSPAISRAEVLAAQATLQGAAQVLSTSNPPPTTIGQVVADLHESDPGLPLSSGRVATRSGLVGITVSPGGTWELAEIAGDHCVVASGSASTGISESETPVSATGGCVA